MEPANTHDSRFVRVRVCVCVCVCVCVRTPRCHGGIAIMCVKGAEVALDNCTVGGTAHGAQRASDGIVAMCT